MLKFTLIEATLRFEFGVFGKVDFSHAPFAQLFENFVETMYKIVSEPHRSS
jgi:hypothetical protein